MLDDMGVLELDKAGLRERMDRFPRRIRDQMYMHLAHRCPLRPVDDFRDKLCRNGQTLTIPIRAFFDAGFHTA